jgi:general stress protein YciG
MYCTLRSMNLHEAAAILAQAGGRARAKALSAEELSKIASKGGKARARALTAEQRRKIARKAIQARWAKRGGR